MTALAGLWRFDGRAVGDDCARMLGAQRIYGPHATAHWDGGFVAMGRSLYRLLDEDRFDRQPLQGMGGNVVLVADLRLDNRGDLLEALGVSAERARSLSDAHVLLAAYERWQEGCLDRMAGDFAVAIWDSLQRRLMLARDPLGNRPLHYHRGARGIAFASMPKGLHALPEISRAVDEERIAEFVAVLPDHGSRTFFQGIERVEPGHILRVTPTSLESRRYWQPARAVHACRSGSDYAESLRDHLDRATRARLRGAGKVVGAQLSAGLDSSIVTTSAACAMSETGGRVIALTGAPREGYAGPVPSGCIGDETSYAATTAAMYPNIEHVVVRGAGRTPLDDLDRFFYLFEQPIPNLCNAAWVIAINDAVRERKIGVMLTGAMGNLTLSYNGIEALPEMLAQGRWIAWLRAYTGLVRSGYWTWKGGVAASFAPYLPPAVWLWLNRALGRSPLDVTSYSGINRERLTELDLAGRARARDLDLSHRPRKDGFATRLWALRRIDVGNYNKGVLAGWGIDLRDPTADLRLIEHCLSIPSEQYLSGGVTRALARRAFADRLPAAVLLERRRGHQGADWHERLTEVRGRVGEEIARLQDSAPARRALDLPRLGKLVSEWPQAGWETSRVAMSYRMALLRSLSTGHFLRKAGGSNW